MAFLHRVHPRDIHLVSFLVDVQPVSLGEVIWHCNCTCSHRTFLISGLRKLLDD